MSAKKVAKALTIAGSDSGGGAGIQADLKTFGALGVYGSSVVTAVTAQNTQRVSAVHVVPALIVAAQVKAVLSDIGADAVKTGMLANADIIQAVAKSLQNSPPFPWSLTRSWRQRAETTARKRSGSDPSRGFFRSRRSSPNVPEAEVLVGRRPEARLTSLQPLKSSLRWELEMWSSKEDTGLRATPNRGFRSLWICSMTVDKFGRWRGRSSILLIPMEQAAPLPPPSQQDLHEGWTLSLLSSRHGSI